MSPWEALAVTLALEVAVLVVLGVLVRRETLVSVAWCAVGANLVTHPLAVAAVVEGAPWLAVEGAVVLVEALAFRLALGWGLGWALPIACVANVVSAVCGLLVFPS